MFWSAAACQNTGPSSSNQLGQSGPICSRWQPAQQHWTHAPHNLSLCHLNCSWLLLAGSLISYPSLLVVLDIVNKIQPYSFGYIACTCMYVVVLLKTIAKIYGNCCKFRIGFQITIEDLIRKKIQHNSLLGSGLLNESTQKLFNLTQMIESRSTQRLTNFSPDIAGIEEHIEIFGTLTGHPNNWKNWIQSIYVFLCMVVARNIRKE